MYSQKAGLANVTLSDGTVVPLSIPNDTIDGRGFYVSYNNRDRGVYGSDTTALVSGGTFYILKGNHMAAYYDLIEDGFDACMEYFEQNIEQIAIYSARPPEKSCSLGGM
jgi:hypothetical protein